MSYVQWLDEKSASALIQRKPRTLRKLVKSGKLKVKFRTINGRTYQYEEKDLNRLNDSVTN